VRGRLDGPALTRTAAIGAWAVALWWLWLSGEASRYVGPRTAWVVAFGAIALALAAALQASAVVRPDPRPLTAREVRGALALVLPVLAVLAVPSPDLGSSAAARKALPGSLASLGAAAPAPVREGPLTVVDLQEANRSAAYAERRGVRPGVAVRLEGFVSRGAREGVPGPFLTRFSMFCCAADALPFFARLTGAAGDWPEDTWLRVVGTIARQGGQLVVMVSRAERIDPPDDPFV